MALSPPHPFSGSMQDPLPLPPLSHARERAFSISSNPNDPFGMSSPRLEHSSIHLSSPQRFNLDGLRPRGLSIAQGPPLSIDDFAIPDPFERAMSDDGSEFRAQSAAPTRSRTSQQQEPISAASHSVFGRESLRSAVWPQRSRESSPLGTKPGSRSSSRAASRTPSRPGSRSTSRVASRRGSLVIREPPVVRTGLWAPALINPSIFLELPSSDPLQTLLNKFVPPHERPIRNIEGRWEGRTVQEMVTTASWRALANYARDNIIQAVPSDLATILQLWHLRLHSLLNLLLPHQHYQELSSLFLAIRQSSIPPTALDKAMPFELEVFLARSKAYVPVAGSGAGNEKDLVGAVEDLTLLCRRCKYRARQAGRAVVGIEGSDGRADVRLWENRALRVGMILAGVVVEMRDYPAAIALLQPMLDLEEDSRLPPSLFLALISLHLSSGSLLKARAILERLLEHPTAALAIKATGKGLVASSYGNWPLMQDTLKDITVDGLLGVGAVVINNLAVGLLNAGKLQEAVDLLQTQLKDKPSSSYVEPLLFNLTTMYELQSGSSSQRKVNVLLQTANSVGDGLKPGCLKLS